MVAQAAGLALRAQQIREAIVAGGPVDADEAIRLTSECRRILLGKAKATKNKPAVQTIQQYAALKAAEKAGSVPEGDAA